MLFFQLDVHADKEVKLDGVTTSTILPVLAMYLCRPCVAQCHQEVVALTKASRKCKAGEERGSIWSVPVPGRSRWHAKRSCGKSATRDGDSAVTDYPPTW